MSHRTSSLSEDFGLEIHEKTDAKKGKEQQLDPDFGFLHSMLLYSQIMEYLLFLCHNLRMRFNQSSLNDK